MKVSVLGTPNRDYFSSAIADLVEYENMRVTHLQAFIKHILRRDKHGRNDASFLLGLSQSR